MQLELIRQIEVVKEKMATGELKGSKERETLFSDLLSPLDKPSGYQVPETMQIKVISFFLPLFLLHPYAHLFSG